MSLSWRNRLYIALAPSRLDVVRTSGVLRRSSSHAELAPGVESMAGAPWRGALAALTDALPSLAPRGTRCSVVLSNHYCRYIVVPGNAGLVDDDELAAYARLRLGEIYGAGTAGSWEVRVAAGAPGAPRLACAVDAALMDELRRACSAAKLKLASVRPLLAACFDHWRTRFPAGSFWFAAAEEGRLCVAAIENQAWRTVMCQRITRNVGQELRSMLDRALLTVPGLTADTVYLFSRDQYMERLRGVPGVKVLPLGCSRDEQSTDDAVRRRVFA